MNAFPSLAQAGIVGRGYVPPPFLSPLSPAYRGGLEQVPGEGLQINVSRAPPFPGSWQINILKLFFFPDKRKGSRSADVWRSD